jgi:hypothetical protein
MFSEFDYRASNDVIAGNCVGLSIDIIISPRNNPRNELNNKYTVYGACRA